MLLRFRLVSHPPRPALARYPSRWQCSYHSTGLAQNQGGWSLEILDEMRAGASESRTRQPKTWASTHGAPSGQDAQGSKSVRGKADHRASLWKRNGAQQAKEAILEELEQGLQVYTYTKPVGPPYSSGSTFLLPRCKPPSSSSVVSSSEDASDAGARLKPPMLAYTANYDEADDLLSCLGSGPLGFDLEWNYSHFAKPGRTALLQICSPSLILIIHLSAMSYRIPPRLHAILKDAAIIKTGVAIRNDALKLERDFAIHSRNMLELSSLAKLAEPAKWARTNTLISLRNLARVYLHRRLSKHSVRSSDWEQFPLHREQVEYAASDAFVGLELLRALAEYFRPTDNGAQGGLLQQLDRLNTPSNTNTAIAAAGAAPMELDIALRLSAYDLYQEHMQRDAGEKQKQNLRTALRELRCAPQPSQGPQAPPRAVAPRITSTRPRVGNAKENVDQDEISVTRVLLARDRAMNRWLYSQQTLNQVALASNIKPTTVASYLIDVLFHERKNTKGDETGKARGILDDFTSEDRVRLDRELQDAGPSCWIARKRYRRLSEQLGWSEVAVSARPSTSGSESEYKST